MASIDPGRSIDWDQAIGLQHVLRGLGAAVHEGGESPVEVQGLYGFMALYFAMPAMLLISSTKSSNEPS